MISRLSRRRDGGHRRRHHALAITTVVFLWAFTVLALWNEKAPKKNLLVSAFCNTPTGAFRLTTRLTSTKWTPSRLFLQTGGGDSDSSIENPPSTPSQTGLPAGRVAVVAEEAVPRNIRVERMPRLPVWPVWAGVLNFLVGWILGPEAGSKLEQYVLGGRVCPMQLDGLSTSPFLLLVHHHHNFWKWDALFRKLSALVLPEGFPAHPHRGFTTLTYFLEGDKNNNSKIGGGGFVHRDSIGVKQTYGSKGSYKNQAQWLFTGKGMLHEEMFDFVQNDLGQNTPGYNSRYELYQLWINVPAKHKLDPPRVQLLREVERDACGDETVGDMPRVTLDKTSVSPTNGERLTTRSSVVVLAGNYQPHEHHQDNSVETFQSRAEPLHSDLSVLHVTVEETAKTNPSTPTTTTSTPGWIYDIPAGHDTLIVYVRKGSCTMETTTVSPTTGSTSSKSSSTDVPIHSTVFVEKDSTAASVGSPNERLIVRPKELDEPLDLLVLSGKPLYKDGERNNFVEPVAMQGSMVMNSNSQIQQAYTDYQYGQMGVPWDHTLGDNDWMEHVRQTKPRMSTEISSPQDYGQSNQ